MQSVLFWAILGCIEVIIRETVLRLSFSCSTFFGSLDVHLSSVLLCFLLFVGSDYLHMYVVFSLDYLTFLNNLFVVVVAKNYNKELLLDNFIMSLVAYSKLFKKGHF